MKKVRGMTISQPEKRKVDVRSVMNSSYTPITITLPDGRQFQAFVESVTVSNHIDSVYSSPIIDPAAYISNAKPSPHDCVGFQVNGYSVDLKLKALCDAHGNFINLID